MDTSNLGNALSVSSPGCAAMGFDSGNTGGSSVEMGNLVPDFVDLWLADTVSEWVVCSLVMD